MDKEKKVINLLLKLREIDEIENIKVDGEYVVFYKGNCREVERSESKEIEVDGYKIPAKIEYTECVSYEEREYDGWLFSDVETEKVVRTGTFIYIPISVLKGIYGNDVVEKLKAIDLKEVAKEYEPVERKEYILLNKEYVAYSWDHYPYKVELKGVHHDTAHTFDDAKWLIALIEGKYQLKETKTIGKIELRRYEKGNEKIEVIIDNYGGWMMAVRDKYSSLFNMPDYIIKRLDEVFGKYGIKGFNEQGRVYESIWYSDYDSYNYQWMEFSKREYAVWYLRSGYNLIVPYKTISQLLIYMIGDLKYRFIYPFGLRKFFF